MSRAADLLASARLENASAEEVALEELENKLRWVKPPGISVKDLWKRLGSQGDVAGLLRRLEALREDGGRAVLVGELWYHGSVTLPHIRFPVAAPEGGNVATPTSVEARRTRILELLADHPEGLRHGQIVAAIGNSKSTIHDDLMKLQFKGLTKQDHNGMWRLAPPPAETPSQIDPPAPCTSEPAPPPADPPASTVEIVAEGEVVATVEDEDEDERPAPLSLLDELVAAGRAIEAARREIAEHTADALITSAFEEVAAFVGCPDYTDPREVYRALSERESELLSRIAAAREEAAELRAELERIRGVLRAALGGGS